MKKTNIAEMRSHMNYFLSYVQKGGTVEILKRNSPIAHIVPIEKSRTNVTQLDCGKSTVEIFGDITEPFMNKDEWEMLRS